MNKYLIISLFLLYPFQIVPMEEEAPSKKNFRFKPKLLLNKALLEAALTGNEKDARELISRGANPNTLLRRYQRTPLTLAAQKGYLNICILLLENGATVDHRDTTGCTPLLWAAQEKYPEICELLLKHGADPNATRNEGVGALHKALFQDAPQEFFGTTPESHSDRFALFEKEQSAKSAAICKILIQAGANVNLCTWQYRELAHNAITVADYLSSEPIQVLLHAGVDVTIYTNYYKRPIYKIFQQWPETLNHLVFAPKMQTLKTSISLMETFLLCLNKRFPRIIPKDVRYLLLKYLYGSESTHLMIQRKLQGKAVPKDFNNAAIHALLEYSHERINTYYEEFSKYPKAIVHLNNTQINPLHEFDHKKALENIEIRFSQPKLLCNNPSEVLDEKQINFEAPVLKNKKHTCIVQ